MLRASALLWVACVAAGCSHAMIDELLPTPPGSRNESNDEEGDSALFVSDLLPTPPSRGAVRRDAQSAADDGGGIFDDEPDEDMCADEPPNECEISESNRSSGPSSSRGRGRHERTASMGKRQKWVPWVKQHVKSFGRLLTTVACGAKCPGCDVMSFATTRLAEDCAKVSFGEAALTGELCSGRYPCRSSKPHPPTSCLLDTR